MPVNITDADVFTSPIQAPDDGDPANGATFQLAPQGLANRTRNLHNRVSLLEHSPGTYNRLLPVSRGHASPSSTSGWLSQGGVWLITSGDETSVVFGFSIPHGAILRGVSAVFGSMTADAGAPMSMTLKLRSPGGSSDLGAVSLGVSEVYPVTKTIDDVDYEFDASSDQLLVSIKASSSIGTYNLIDKVFVTFSSDDPAARLYAV